MNAKEIRDLTDKAFRSLEAAEGLLASDHCDFAVSRAYYAMFYAAQAALLTAGVRRAKHSGVIAAFNEQFIKTGKISPDLFLRFREAFQNRAEGDYALTEISEQQGRTAIVAAREFVEELRRHLSKASNEG